MLRDAYKSVSKDLAELVARDSPLISAGVRRAQLEQTRSRLLAKQGEIFEKLGDIVSARRLAAAARSQRLSAAADAALLALVGKGAEAQYLYETALQASQRAIDAALARMRLSAIPLSQRIYQSNLWMNGRLGKLINETLAAGLNARTFAKKARDWFNPNTPGGVRFAAMRLARTEINNSFHAMSAQKYAETPWIRKVEWNLSGSHPKPDECNVLANGSPYESDETPARPHPQCMCYITPVSEDEDEFVENFLKGDYDDYLDKELESKGWDVKESKPRAPAAPAPSRVERVVPAKSNADRPRIPGRDLTDWAASQLRNGYDESGLNMPSDFADPVDRHLGLISKRQGFDGLPSEAPSEGVEIFRGVTPGKEISAEEILERFRSGAYEPGTGIYGNGFYFSVSPRVASYYAGLESKKGPKGKTLRVVLRSDAKIIDYDDLEVAMRDWKSKILENSPSLADLFGPLDFRTPEGMYPPSLINVMGDPGRWAAMMGYDAIRVQGKQDGAPFVKGEPSAKNSAGGKFSAHDQYIILNRTAITLGAAL